MINLKKAALSIAAICIGAIIGKLIGEDIPYSNLIAYGLCTVDAIIVLPLIKE